MCTHTLKTIEKRTAHLEQDPITKKLIRVEDPYNGEMETFIDDIRLCSETPQLKILPFSDYLWRYSPFFRHGCLLFVGTTEQAKEHWNLLELPNGLVPGNWDEEAMYVISPEEFLVRGMKFDLWGWLVVCGVYKSRSELRRNNNIPNESLQTGYNEFRHPKTHNGYFCCIDKLVSGPGLVESSNLAVTFNLVIENPPVWKN